LALLGEMNKSRSCRGRPHGCQPDGAALQLPHDTEVSWHSMQPVISFSNPAKTYASGLAALKNIKPGDPSR
jgi:hypothetical protein